MKLLFIDDDPGFNDLATQASTNYGVDFKVVDNFQDADKLLKSYEPTHVFVDIFVPKGNGIDFVKEHQSYPGKFYLMTVDFEKEGAADRLNNSAVFFNGTITKDKFINGLRALVMSDTGRN